MKYGECNIFSNNYLNTAKLQFRKKLQFKRNLSSSAVAVRNCRTNNPVDTRSKLNVHLKSSFRSQDIKVFVTTFWSCRKNGLIRKIKLTSKFVTSQPGLQIITKYIYCPISHNLKATRL